MKPNKKASKTDRIWRVAAVLFWLLAWQGGAMLLRDSLLLVSPLRVLRQLFALMREKSFYAAVLFSLGRNAAGFGLGLAAGALLAALAARFPAAEYLLRPLMVTVRSIPVASFIIIALVWLSSRRVSVFIVFLMVLPIVYGNLLEGLRGKSARMEEMARMYRIPWHRRFVFIDLPQLRPALLSALTLSLGLSWKSGVAAEIIGVPRGSMGYALYQSKLYLDTPSLYAWTLTVVLLSVLFERAVLFIVKRGFIRLERL
ncbi:MAG: ABC transporter permease subunit [Clostridia bacterium]|nr:ABC transporter permease subunit [Clostridia bacterium]